LGENNGMRPTTGRQFLGILLLRSLLALSLAAAAAFALDAAWLRYRASTHHNAFGTVTVHPYYNFPRKDKKTEIVFDDPRDETCVQSLFPQMGYSPCWYLRGHSDYEMPNTDPN
jgi:hypothetical protein